MCGVGGRGAALRPPHQPATRGVQIHAAYPAGRTAWGCWRSRPRNGQWVSTRAWAAGPRTRPAGKAAGTLSRCEHQSAKDACCLPSRQATPACEPSCPLSETPTPFARSSPCGCIRWGLAAQPLPPRSSLLFSPAWPRAGRPPSRCPAPNPHASDHSDLQAPTQSTRVRARARTRTHAHARTRTHALTHARTDTQTRARTQERGQQGSSGVGGDGAAQGSGGGRALTRPTAPPKRPVAMPALAPSIGAAMAPDSPSHSPSFTACARRRRGWWSRWWP